MDKDKQKPENINDIVLTPLPTDLDMPKIELAARPARTPTQEIYFQNNDKEAWACQRTEMGSVIQGGVDFCSKPHCKCMYQKQYKQDPIKKTCSYKPK